MPDQFKIHPETTLLVPLCRVIGGKTTVREVTRDENDGETREIEAKLTTRIDDESERKRAEQIALKGGHLIAKASTGTLIGRLAPRDRVAEIQRQLSGVRVEANEFNSQARTCRVEVGMLPIEIAIALGPEAARALADHVRTELEALRDALRAGEVSKARAILLPTRGGNLDQLSVGVQAESIRFAIDEGNDRLCELRGKLKEDQGISKTPETAGKELDLTMIEAAIGMFTYAPPVALSMVG